MKQHIDKVLENAPTQLKVSVNVNDADWQKIQELFAKEHQWMTAQMQTHIREVNSMFADERKKVRERYKEYDGCYLGHYAQWFFWFFFTIGFFVIAGGIGMIVAQNYGKQIKETIIFYVSVLNNNLKMNRNGWGLVVEIALKKLLSVIIIDDTSNDQFHGIYPTTSYVDESIGIFFSEA